MVGIRRRAERASAAPDGSYSESVAKIAGGSHDRRHQQRERRNHVAILSGPPQSW
jgi:hypothetical protein